MQRHYDKELGEVVVPAGACPYPIGDDDGTAKQCVQRGHCACDEITKPENRTEALGALGHDHPQPSASGGPFGQRGPVRRS